MRTWPCALRVVAAEAVPIGETTRFRSVSTRFFVRGPRVFNGRLRRWEYVSSSWK